MKTRKLTAVLLALIMAFAVLPAAAFAESIEGIAGEAAAMRKLDNAWAALDAAEADALAQGMSRTEVINAVYTAALSLNTVDKDSFSAFTKDGFYFTVDGMYCAYNYRLRNELGKVTEPANDGIFTIKGSGSILKMHIGNGDFVERGELLFETVTGTLDGLYALLLERRAQRPAGSYTTYLFDKGREKILKKVGEECTEVVIGAMKGSREETVFEVADLTYHVLVLLAEMGVTPDQVRQELARRHVVDHKVKQETLQ